MRSPPAADGERFRSLSAVGDIPQPVASIDEKIEPGRAALRFPEILLNSLILLRVNLQDSEKHTLLHFERWALANIQVPDIQSTPFP